MKKTLSFVIVILMSLQQHLFAATSTDSICEKPRFNLGHTVVDAALSFGINAGATELLKHSVKEMRPDRSDNRSFPSRHTSYAFTIASIASHELYQYSPFWVTSAQTVANAIGMQRVYAGRHFPSDVLAGASLGIASTEAGYALGRLIFDTPHSLCYNYAENYSSLDAVTTALIPLSGRGNGYSVGCGIETALRLSLASESWWGISAAYRMRSQPLYLDRIYRNSINSYSLTLECFAVTPVFDGQWAIDGRISAGPIRNFRRPYHCVSSWSCILDIYATISRQITKKLSVGASAGLDITDRPSTPCSLLLALTTKAQF